MRSFAAITVGAALALSPARANAQLETFVRAARDLAVAAEQPEPARAAGRRAAVDRMASALVVWDANIRALEARVQREKGAPASAASQLHVELAVAYRFRGRLADALREFDAAAALRPSSDLQMLRALTLEGAGRQTAAAAEAFRAAWRLDPSNPLKAYYVADRSESDTGDRSRAQDVLRSAYRSLDTAAATQAPLPFLTLDAIPDSMSNKAVAGDADTAEAFSLLASSQFGEAVAALSRTGQKRPAAGAPDRSPRGHLQRGLAAEAANRVPDARHEYQAALSGTLAGRHVIYVAIARLAQVDGDSAGALDAYARAVRLSPNDASIRREFAASLSADGRMDEAFRELMAALLIDARDGIAHAGIGQLLLDSGRNAEAVDAFSRALQLAPARYEVRYSLATAYTRLGDTTKAAEELATFDRARRQAEERRRRDLSSQ